MEITIWGAHGSIPTPITTEELRRRLQETLERSQGVNLKDSVAVQRYIDRLPPTLNMVVSGNTSCVELRVNDALFILDMGSGMRLLGKKLLKEAFGSGEGTAQVFISHTHYDHLEGFPFFVPVFIPGNQFHFHSPYEDMEWRLQQFMRHPFFPVDLDYPQGTKTFTTLDPALIHDIEGVQVELLELNHPGRAFAYKFTHGGKIFVYASDGEYQNMEPEHTAIYEDFFRNADVLILMPCIPTKMP